MKDQSLITKTKEGLDLPGESDATAVAHAVTQDLAGQDLVGVEDGDQLLLRVRYKQTGDE